MVIPERLEALGSLWPSPMVAYRNDIASAVNSPKIAPDYRVWAIIDEKPYTRVLILKKQDPQAPDSGLELFPRTWGTAAQVIGRDFKGALIVGQKPWWQYDANAASTPTVRLRKLQCSPRRPTVYRCSAGSWPSEYQFYPHEHRFPPPLQPIHSCA